MLEHCVIGMAMTTWANRILSLWSLNLRATGKVRQSAGTEVGGRAGELRWTQKLTGEQGSAATGWELLRLLPSAGCCIPRQTRRKSLLCEANSVGVSYLPPPHP